MKKVFFFLLISICLIPNVTLSKELTPRIGLDDAQSFQIARAFKLGGGDSGVYEKGFKVKGQDSSKPSNGMQSECVGDSCQQQQKCKSASDCDPNQYCSSVNICKDLCEKGTTYDGKSCAGFSKTPTCAIETSGHMSYCACTSTSCDAAWECKLSGVQYQCGKCPAGQTCRCPDGKIANGKGECVVCNSSNDCADDQACRSAGTVSSSCETLSCASNQYVGNHQCNTCSSTMPNCTSCSGASSCNSCEPAYNLRSNKTGCDLKSCSAGQYLDMSSGNCYSCPSGCSSCTSSSQCTACNSGYVLSGSSCIVEDKDADCLKYCGSGFSYDRPGAKNGGAERVCTRYPLSCGYDCTTGWDIDYLVKGTNYTCQTAIQQEKTENKDADCVKYCGSGFYYDRPGAKLNGTERVCTRYPLSCGYNCTTGWDIDYLVQGTVYTCQTAIQKAQDDSKACTGSPTKGGEGTYGSDCLKYCGSGFNYDRPGAKLNGAERVCTRYPKPGGYNCTTGWNIDYLVKGTVYTCQTAIMSDTRVR